MTQSEKPAQKVSHKRRHTYILAIGDTVSNGCRERGWGCGALTIFKAAHEIGRGADLNCLKGKGFWTLHFELRRQHSSSLASAVPRLSIWARMIMRQTADWCACLVLINNTPKTAPLIKFLPQFLYKLN